MIMILTMIMIHDCDYKYYCDGDSCECGSEFGYVFLCSHMVTQERKTSTLYREKREGQTAQTTLYREKREGRKEDSPCILELSVPCGVSLAPWTDSKGREHV